MQRTRGTLLVAVAGGEMCRPFGRGLLAYTHKYRMERDSITLQVQYRVATSVAAELSLVDVAAYSVHMDERSD